VWELYIDYFRDAITGKDWKVCIGDNIAYSATGSPDCNSWTWEMKDVLPEDPLPRAWHPAGGDAKTGAGLVIPCSDLAGATNSSFGDSYGTVYVSCIDGDTNSFTFNSGQMYSPRRARVFFPPNLGVNGHSPSQSNSPCWHAFWQQTPVAVPNLSDTRYNHALGAYGASWIENGWIYGYNLIVEVGPDASGTHYNPAIVINGHSFGGPSITGIDCCAEVVEHERTHNAHGLLVLGGSVDSDGDKLPDNLEAAIACVVGNQDTFDLAHIKSPEYSTYGDDEYSVMLAADGKKGVAGNDWSKGGKQW
jgi:hypothetical protein